MRYGLAVVAGCLVLAWTASSALSAQSEGAKAPPSVAADTNLRAISQQTTTAVSTPADGAAIAPAGAAAQQGKVVSDVRTQGTVQTLTVGGLSNPLECQCRAAESQESTSSMVLILPCPGG